jgi:hypothetical protein
LRLPLLWIVVPFLWLPGATIIGDRLYAWVASNRFNLVGGACTGNVCSMNEPASDNRQTAAAGDEDANRSEQTMATEDNATRGG